MNPPFQWFKVGLAFGLVIGVVSMTWFRWTFAYGCFAIGGLLLIGYLNYRFRRRRHPQARAYWLAAGVLFGNWGAAVGMLTWFTFALVSAGALSMWYALRNGLVKRENPWAGHRFGW